MKRCYCFRDYILFPFIVIRNFFLVKRYSFLKPSLGYGCDMHYNPKGYKYHYEETWLDGLPKGWRKAFGLKICEELRKVIKDYNLKDYTIDQVKEKFGGLCWYDDGGNDETYKIIIKYEELSYKICQQCGKPAEYMTKHWIGYYCEKCARKFKNFNTGDVIKIDRK